ncbi:MAG: restriction endonuclease subunit S [Aeromonas veronii]
MTTYIFNQDWEVCQLDDLLCYVIGGDWGKEPDHEDENYKLVACIRGAEFKNWKNDTGATAVSRKIKRSSLENRNLQPGDILIEISGGGPEQPVGRTVLITEHVLKKFDTAVVGTNFLRLARPYNQVSSKYLNYFLTYFYISGQVVHYQGGSNNLRNLKFKEYSAIEVPFASFYEQKEIADRLDILLAQVEATQARLARIPDIIKQFRQSVLSAAVSGKLTEDWRNGTESIDDPMPIVQTEKRMWIEKNPSHNEVNRVLKRVREYKWGKTISEIELPANWSWQQLEDSVLMIVDCHNKTAPYVESGIPLIRTSNIRDGEFVWQDLKFINQETYEYWSRRCPPEPGDIIFTREAPMGEAAIVPTGHRVCLGQRTMLIRPVENLVSARYLLLAIMEPNFKKRSDIFAVGTGVKHYRVGDVSNLIIPIPPTEEQAEIVRRVEQLFTYADSIELQAKAAKEQVDNLTQAILAKAFRGELTADWRAANPDLISGDNSAAALLARIQAERATAKPRKRATKTSTA